MNSWRLRAACIEELDLHLIVGAILLKKRERTFGSGNQSHYSSNYQALRRGFGPAEDSLYFLEQKETNQFQEASVSKI